MRAHSAPNDMSVLLATVACTSRGFYLGVRYYAVKSVYSSLFHADCIGMGLKLIVLAHSQGENRLPLLLKMLSSHCGATGPALNLEISHS